MKLNPFKKENELDKTIGNLTAAMAKVQPESDEYKSMASNLEILLKAKSHQKDKGIDPNTLLLIGATLVQTVLILKHEQLDVITSKAMNFVMKMRA